MAEPPAPGTQPSPAFKTETESSVSWNLYSSFQVSRTFSSLHTVPGHSDPAEWRAKTREGRLHPRHQQSYEPNGIWKGKIKYKSFKKIAVGKPGLLGLH